MKQQRSTVKHTLRDAPEIKKLLESGDAVYATEIRCPRTMFSRIEHAANSEQSINLPETERNDNLYLIPGIIVARDTSLSTTGLHNLVHINRKSVEVPAGWWLAYGGEYQFTPLLVNLLKFFKDNSLKPGTMKVEEAGELGNPYFRVNLSAELYDHGREKRDVQIAALIAVFGHFPRSSLREDGENYDSPVAQELRAKLEDHDPPLPDWDKEDYDPAQAATSLEQFWISIGDSE
ncbi:hypothetical protein [Candidatus Poriferisocius sp.]|uniref:hypothetical protein n=1 Tax=Candidatus Poriferisocius sp. TaxID=3101276 RepID=UPI003B02C0A5